MLSSLRRRTWLRRPLPYWLATAALAAVTGLVVAGLVGRAGATVRRYGTVRDVVVATAPIAAGDVVTEAAVTVRRLPAAMVPDGALSRPPIGRTATSATYQGEPLLAVRLAPAGVSGAAALLPPGTSGLAVPVDTGPPLAVGDLVDVLATFDPGSAGGGDPSFAVASAAPVVAVGDAVVTVAVPTTDAPRVAFALAQGTVILALTASG